MINSGSVNGYFYSLGFVKNESNGRRKNKNVFRLKLLCYIYRKDYLKILKTIHKIKNLFLREL
jgi:hypothetical protein